MSSKLKKIIIIAVVFIVLGLGGLFVYTSFSGMQNIVISNFQIVDSENNVIQNRQEYLGKLSSNKFMVKVNVSANGNSGGYYLYSTNQNVAKIISENGNYYVEYYASGDTSIVAKSVALDTISDSFVLTVKENVALGIEFDDNVGIDNQELRVFADGIDHEFPYVLSATDMSTVINSSSVKVGYFDEALFNSVSIDADKDSLVVNAKEAITSSSTYITLQSFTKDSHGNDVTVANFMVKIDIVGNAIEKMRLVVSDTPDFVNTINVTSIEDGGEYVQDKTVFLNYEIKMLYARVVLLLTNGNELDVTNNTKTSISVSQGSGEVEFFDDCIGLKIVDATTKYYVHIADQVYLDSDEVLGYFTITYKSTDLSINDLYKKNGNNYYEYIYFDMRFRRHDEIVDTNGNIISFTDSAWESEYHD